MEVDKSPTIEIIDLCTPMTDICDLRDIKVPIPQYTSTPKSFKELYPNVGRRWSILACYPTNKYEEYGEPLLANIPRMYIT